MYELMLLFILLTGHNTHSTINVLLIKIYGVKAYNRRVNYLKNIM